jgi:hypothetical protein
MVSLGVTFIVLSLIGGMILIGAQAGCPYGSWFDKFYFWEFVNPYYVYCYNTSVNWFGATLIALCLSALCPIGAILYWIYKIIYTLCTIGRRK